MKINIKPGRPPNFKEIVEVFPQAAKRTTLFAYDDTIYISSGSPAIPDFLIAHETVHLERQQKIGVKEWWDKYLTEHDFRYYEELLAHRAEFQRMIKFSTSESWKKKVVIETAKRLTNSLYRFSVTLEQAIKDIGENNV